MTNKPRIIIPTTRFGVDTREAYRKFVADGDKNPDTPDTSNANLHGNVTSLTDCWEIPNVEYRNGIYTVNLAKSLLDNGNAKTQNQWIEYSKQAKQNGSFYVGDMALQYAMFRALSLRQTEESVEARDFIKKQMREKWLMTTTRLKYNPKGNDEVVHDYGMSTELKNSVELVGPDRFVDANDSSVLECLLGDKDVNSVNQVFNFINGTNAYIWRLNSKPKKLDERVAGFFADSGRASLDCYRSPGGVHSSLGVFAAVEVGEARGQ